MTTEEKAITEGAHARKVWIVNKTPDSDPQLAERLSLLSDALQLELQLVDQELCASDHNSDLLTQDRNTHTAIVIEHRSHQTKQYQLGEFLACAEDYDARILIWIADNFREEHRSALDWLNRWTPEDVEVFGVEIRSTVKGDAGTSPQFVPVVAPAAWSESGEGERIPRIHAVVLRDLFQKLADELHNKGFMDKHHIVTKYDQSFPSGLSEVDFHASFEADGYAWVYIPGWPSRNNQILNQLRNDTGKRATLESKLNLPSGTYIKWKTGANSTGVYRKASLNDSEEELDAVRKWMLDYLLKFQNFFNPHLDAIVAKMNNPG